MKQEVKVEGWSRYEAHSYVAGVIAEGRRLLLISGMTATDDAFRVLAPGDLVEQTRICYRKIAKVLEAAGADFGNVVALRDFVVAEKLADYWDADAVRREFLKDTVIASTAIGVTGLAKPGLLIEIEATAVLDR